MSEEDKKIIEWLRKNKNFVVLTAEQIIPILKMLDDYKERLQPVNATEKESKSMLFYEIDKKGNLALCYETFLNRKAKPNEIEICAYNDNGTRYTIASFDYNKKECCYELNSCSDRLNSDAINWEDFGKLVLEGYKILDNLSND